MNKVIDRKMVDIHLHILPGLDDGARTMQEAIKMARIAFLSGVGTIVVTPHANQKNRFENYATIDMRHTLEKFCSQLRHNAIPLQVVPGMEIRVTVDVVEKIKAGKLCPMGKTNCFLMEFPCNADPVQMQQMLDYSLEAYCRPIIAHPERYLAVQQNLNLIERWKGQGCFIQLSKDSIQGYWGLAAYKSAEYMIENGWADAVASDAHDVRYRTPEMHSIKKYLTNRFGKACADFLLIDNPQRILQLT